MGEADLNLAVRDYSKPIVPIFQGKEGFRAYVQIVTNPPTKFDADAAKKKAAENLRKQRTFCSSGTGRGASLRTGARTLTR